MSDERKRDQVKLADRNDREIERERERSRLIDPETTLIITRSFPAA